MSAAVPVFLAASLILLVTCLARYALRARARAALRERYARAEPFTLAEAEDEVADVIARKLREQFALEREEARR